MLLQASVSYINLLCLRGPRCHLNLLFTDAVAADAAAVDVVAADLVVVVANLVAVDADAADVEVCDLDREHVTLIHHNL